VVREKVRNLDRDGNEPGVLTTSGGDHQGSAQVGES